MVNGSVGEAFGAEVVDEHAELRAEVADVILADDGVAEELQHAGEGVADDGGAQVADVHLLGDVGAGVIDDDGLRAGRCGPTPASAIAGRGRWRKASEGAGEEILVRRRLMKPGPAMVGSSQRSARLRCCDDLGGDSRAAEG